jgi:hypothetical protein
MAAECRLILVEDDPDPHPPFFDEHDLAVIALYKDDPDEAGDGT